MRYRPNQRCVWLLTAPDIKTKVGLRFQYFQLDNSDRLEVEEEDGSQVGRRSCFSVIKSLSQVAVFRGGQPTHSIISGGRQLRLTFYSDASVAGRGFSLSFHPVEVEQCGGELTGRAGRIVSPAWPHWYPPGATCTWVITAPANTFLSMNFTFVSVHGTDRLGVWELGERGQETYIAAVSEPAKLLSLSGQAVVRFTSNSWGQAQGFTADWGVAGPGCGGQVYLTPHRHATLATPLLQPSLGTTRPGYLSCRWEVEAERGHRMLVIGSPPLLPACTAGFLEWSEAVRGPDHNIRLCSNVTLPLPRYTAASRILVEFMADIQVFALDQCVPHN